MVNKIEIITLLGFKSFAYITGLIYELKDI